MHLVSMPERADNAENSVKCSICGNSILVGGEDGTGQETAVCDICGHEMSLPPGGVAGVSNEDY